jgi:hypothetical protein
MLLDVKKPVTHNPNLPPILRLRLTSFDTLAVRVAALKGRATRMRTA